MEVDKILSVLAKERPVFHSEADFQHAFAWEIHQSLPNALVRLERPIQVNGELLYIDVWIAYQGAIIAIELKYKTRRLAVQVDDEQYSLRDQSAQDIGRYDFIKDIQRLEQVAAANQNITGYAVLLTNDSAYWKPNYGTVDADFRLHDGRILRGVLAWGAGASEGTKKNREQPLELQGEYQLKWSDYSFIESVPYGKFRSLVVKVKPTAKAG